MADFLMKFLIKCLVPVLIFSSLNMVSQRTAIYADADFLYKEGVELFDKKQYVSAQKNFQTFAATTKSSLLKADATYYAAACAIELFNKDGEWLMREFIKLYPESNRINRAYFYLANSNFRKKKYPETIEFLEKTDIYKLEKQDLAEYYFKHGYSSLQLGNDVKAKADFFEIKDVDNKYAFPANYYYSHLEYKDKNYENAVKGFNRLIGNETFGKVVPFYITQIYFIQGKFKEVTQEAPKLLADSSGALKEPEIKRMIGESYFNLKDYANALKYFQGSNLNAQGYYAIAYCYYKLGDYTKAAPNFEKALGVNDTLSQNAAYHLADCSIRNGDKLKAKNAYYNAYQFAVNPKITEDALFSFAKLSYELDFNPYNESVKSFTKFLKEYPASTKREDCLRYLVTVYSTTKNYEQAIISIESLDKIDPILKATYQKLIYFRGVEFFNNGDYDNAEKQFKKSQNQNADMHLNSLTQYWLSEINYIRKDYNTAIEGFKKFQLTQGAAALPEYELSNYALGYAYFQRREKDDYTNANLSFRKFLLSTADLDKNKIVDATLRTADTYFMNRDFVQASDYYKKAIGYNKLDIDYSLYQKALCDGLTKNYQEKIAGLKKIESSYPNSIYLSTALNQIADTYFNNLQDDQNAITYYNKILNNYPNSSFVGNCYAQLGQIYYNRKEDDKALEYFDKYVKLDRQSDEAKIILTTIKKIYEAKGDVEGSIKYFESIGNPLSENEIEKASYAAAYDAFYNQKNCDAALPKWEAYIAKFPTGKYIAEAQFNMAECAYSKNEFEKALSGYKFIINRQRSTYSETALYKTTYVLYKDKKYEEVLPLFKQLEDIAETPANKSTARLGAMRAAYYLNNYEAALEACVKVLSLEKLSPQQTSEAKYIKARALYETKRLDDALTEFKAMAKTAKNLQGAEALYYIGKIQFIKQDYKEVEKTVNKLISYEYSNDDWNNRAMLLLADMYLAKKDRADAKVILETVIDSKPKQEFLDEAKAKLKLITDEEEAEKKALEVPPTANPDGGNEMRLNFEGSGNEQNLFNPDETTPAVTPTTGTIQPK